MLSKTKNNWIYWIVQFIGWGAYNLIIYGLVYLNGQIKITNRLILYFAFSFLLAIAISHISRYLIIKFNWLNKSVWQIIVLTILGATLASTLYEAGQSVYNLHILPADFYSSPYVFQTSEFFINVFISFIVFSLWYGFYYAYLFIERSRLQEIKNLQFEASRNEIELKNLRAQINPHFLFNSLNSIKALVEIDKSESKKAITKLSNLLRNSLNLSKKKLISLEEELDLVRTYLDLEKIRFEDHIHIKFDIDPNSRSFKIPPLMIQTITENAIKHGLSKLIDGGQLIISSKFENEELTILIKNTGLLNNIESSVGIGIENTRKRLSLIYGDNASFDLFEDGGMVNALINIKNTK